MECLFNTFSQMVTGTVKVLNENGIHLRLAGELVKAASRFESRITIASDEQQVDAKSILGVAGLGAEFGVELLIQATGNDENEALAFLKQLFENKFAIKDD
ncbi:MAG: HPr family phosphocarrier protein [bacterium]|nr:MAG: HPr family phosphocarrier protein [bacterium]